MVFDTENATYQELLAHVMQTGARVVPFVGAGISVYGGPSERLPLWRELIERLIAEGTDIGLLPDEGDPQLNEALRVGRFIEATDRVIDALGEPTFRRVVERELNEHGKPMPPAIAELVAVGWSLIVTTNLDRLIWRAYAAYHGKPMTRVNGLDTHTLAKAMAGTISSQDATLAQIHGDIDVYSSWRLTGSHYLQLLNDPGYVKALEHLFLKRLFFVGFGLQDDDFDLLIRTIAKIYPAGAGEFYALVSSDRKREPTLLELVKKCGLRPIYYDVDPDPDPADPFGGHRAVYECLAHLAAAWASANTNIDVNLKYFPELDPNMVGREQEIASLAELAIEGAAIVQLTGLGGLGKTTLLQRFVKEHRSDVARAGYRTIFGCSLQRAEIAQLVQDMALATAGAKDCALPQHVERICEHVGRHRTLLLLDGFEVILDAERKLRNPHVRQILESIVAGEGAVILTTRVSVRDALFESGPVIELLPLSDDQVRTYLHRWGLGRLGDAATQRLVDITAGHPLALRILAGVLRDVPAADAMATIERSAIIDVSDEIDPLSENRLARVLGSYVHHLGDAEIAFLTCATVFDAPAPYSLVDAALTRDYPDTSVNAPLVNADLRKVVNELIARRLLTDNAASELSSHPTVREYFARYVRESGQSLIPIHRYLAAEYLRDAAALPETLPEAFPLISAARHAAACRDWTLFDDVFRCRLMRDFRYHLCNNLGAWEETLELARLGDNESFLTNNLVEPGYYPFAAARCLKHLGRSSESRACYLQALRTAAATKDPGTAMYVNNLLTLLVWRGELAAADRLAELNVRALSWITEPWRQRWQVEHGFSSIAYLRMLQGNFDAAEALFDHAAHAWDGYPDKRRWIYDYYPYHRAELILIANADAHEEALASVESLLTVAGEHGWPESICRGHIQCAMVHLDRAVRLRDEDEIAEAERRLDRANGIVAGIKVADVGLAHHRVRFRLELLRREFSDDAGRDTSELEDLLARAELLIETSELALAHPEVTAARGVLAYLHGDVRIAEERHARAEELCRRQGNMLTLASPRSLLNWLGRHLGQEIPQSHSPSSLDLVGLVGTDLTPTWMLERLDVVDGMRPGR